MLQSHGRLHTLLLLSSILLAVERAIVTCPQDTCVAQAILWHRRAVIRRYGMIDQSSS